MFAPLIEVLLKSSPLKVKLHPTRRVIEFEDRVIDLGSLSFLVAIIVEISDYFNS